MNDVFSFSQFKAKQGTWYGRIISLWETIISIGISDELSDWAKRRTRLLNGICLMAVISLSTYCIAFIDKKFAIFFWFSLLGLIIYAVILLLNFRRKYDFACHFFSTFNVIYYSFMSISMGLYNGAEYLIVPSSITSMIIFKNFRIILFYFFFNAIAFVLCKFSFTAIEPFLVMPIKEGLYIPNQFLMFTILFLIVYYFKSENLRQEKLLETQNMSLAMEQQKSEKLLLNILPRETAEELKHTGAARSRQFDSVTILFSDFKNFTLASERMSPEELVNEIHRYFSYFDSIMEKYGLEKIKTIGDAYMCAGGIPDENTTHAADVIRAAIDMQQYVANLKKEKIAAGEIFFEIRIGIHTGPVVAGIVGTKKFAYDVWGDTVNLASRMESSGEVGRVNISATTYELVKDSIPCEYRGKVSAKNKGEIDMYFVVV